MKDFIKSAEEAPEEGEAITFKHWGHEVTFYEPSDGQQLLMLSLGGRSMGREAASKFLQLFIQMGDAQTQEYIQDLMLDKSSGFGLKTEGGLFDIWEQLNEHWSGKASSKPSGSAKSASGTGRASTGNSRRRASTSSRSRSTDS